MTRMQAYQLASRINRTQHYHVTHYRQQDRDDRTSWLLEVNNVVLGIPFVIRDAADWEHRLEDAAHPY